MKRRLNEVLSIIKEDLENSGGSGIPNLMRSKLTGIRLMWAVCLLVGVALTIYLIVQNVIAYFEYQVITESRINIKAPISFPKVTVCNLDPFTTNESISFLAELIKSDYNYSTSLNNTQSISDLDLVNYYILNKPDFQSKALYAAYKSGKRFLFGYSYSSFVKRCKFESFLFEATDIDLELTYDTEYGNCYTFNSNKTKPILTSKKAGKLYGLQLELVVGKPDYYESFASSSGVRVFIYNHDTLYSDSNGIDVAVSTETNIALTKTNSKKLKFPFSECHIDAYTDQASLNSRYYDMFVANNLSYMFSNCLEVCYQNILLEQCKCVDPDLGYFNLSGVAVKKFCSFDNGSVELDCINELTDEETLNGRLSLEEKCKSLCPIECDQVTYSFSSSFSVYPLESYRKRFMKNLDANSSKNLLKLNIYYHDLSYQSITEAPMITVVGLLSSIGGIFSLFLGFSVLTFFEFIESFFKSLVHLYSTRKSAQVLKV